MKVRVAGPTVASPVSLLETATVTSVSSSRLCSATAADSDGHQEYEVGLSAKRTEIDFEKENPEVTTFAGSSQGSTDATGTSAKFANPNGVTTDGTNLYVVDQTNHKIRKIVISTGVVTTLAGASSGYADSTDGTGLSASFKEPAGITTDGTNLYVSDYANHRIRKIVISTGVVTTLAGSGSASFADGTGTSASFYSPMGITTDGTNLYVADFRNHRIRKIE